MIVHHAQAVEMAEIVRDRTQSDDIRILASDISLTQQAQIGIMQGCTSVRMVAMASLPRGGEGVESDRELMLEDARSISERLWSMARLAQDAATRWTGGSGRRI
jgi:uncharacterized protein (DUF305 family)